ncbi:Cysteine protease family c01a [Globisporangium polare]
MKLLVATAITALALLRAPVACNARENLARALDASSPLCGWIYDNIDSPGGDLMQFKIDSAEGCCGACKGVSDCNTFTWTKYQGGTCFLKSTSTNFLDNHSDGDGSPYMRTGTAYKCGDLQINKVFVDGYDIGNARAYSIYECCGHCRRNAECTKYTWTEYNGGTCWLKAGGSSMTKAPMNDGTTVNSAMRN